MGCFIEPRKEREDGWMWGWGVLIFQPVLVAGYLGHAADAVTVAISPGVAIGACIAVIRRYRHAAGAWLWLFLYLMFLAPSAIEVARDWLGWEEDAGSSALVIGAGSLVLHASVELRLSNVESAAYL